MVGQFLSLQQDVSGGILQSWRPTTAVGNAFTSFTSLLPGLLGSCGAALSPGFSNEGHVKESWAGFQHYPVLLGSQRVLGRGIVK